MSAGPVRFFPDVLEEFFEELDFLWMQREANLFSSDWSLRDLGALEERAEACLDGLRLSGDAGVQLAGPNLRGEDRGAATAATFVLMEGKRPELTGEVLRALTEADGPAQAGVGAGLRHVDVASIAGDLRRLADGANPVTASIALDLLAFHRLGTPPPKLFELFACADPAVRARAYHAAGRFGGPWSPDQLQSALGQPSTEVRWAAIHASARLGLPSLQEMLRRAATRPADAVGEAMEFLGALGDPADLPLFKNLMARPASRIPAIRALGASGYRETIPLLLDSMQDPASAVAAGRAFERITGARGIDASQPLPPPTDLTEDEQDLHVPVRPPDPGKARAWWEREQARFGAGSRWQAGVAVGPTGFPADPECPLDARRDLYLSQCARGPRPSGVVELEARAGLQVG